MDDNIFLNWKNYNENVKSGTNCLPYRALKAAEKLNIFIKIIDKTIIIKDQKTNYSKECNNYKAIANFINNIVKRRWQEQLNQPTLHLHGFHSLKNAPYSNGFIINVKRPIEDNLFIFAIKARTNTLPTPANVELYNNIPHKNCIVCEQSNVFANVSLLHILNKCISSYHLINIRHNKISTIIREQIIKNKQVEEILENRNVPLDNLSERSKNLRPDTIVITNNRQKMTIIEITCPYANFSNNHSTLETAFNNKRAKYNNLIEEIRENGIDVEFHIFVISSLGAIYNETWISIQKLFPPKKIQAKIAHKLVCNALFGSANFTFNAFLNDF